MAALLVAGCSSWRAVPKPMPGSADVPQYVRILVHDGRLLEVDSPVVRGDSLFGQRADPGDLDSLEVAMSIQDIRSIEARKADGAKSLFLVLGVVGVAFLIGTIVVGYSAGEVF
jgi:hypothetical protein